MSLLVEKITDEASFNQALYIRNTVFVLEQGVNPADEYDTFEQTSVHFLARLHGQAVGAARWRFTDKGIKLERFAVLKEFRGQGVGQALVAAVLQSIASNPEAKGKIKYLHAQLDAIPLYAKFGFEPQGDLFEECHIKHYKMVLV